MQEKNMKRILLFITALFYTVLSWAQLTGHEINFSKDWSPSWHHPNMNVSTTSNSLVITGANLGPGFENLVGVMPTQDLSNNPVVKVTLRTSEPIYFQFRILDQNGKETNDGNPELLINPSEEFQEYTFDFTNKFKQSWPIADVVDPKTISKFSIVINSGKTPGYSGILEIKRIVTGDGLQFIDPYSYQPKVNQLGYLVGEPKKAVFISHVQVPFKVRSTGDGAVVLEGQSSAPKYWSLTKSTVVQLDMFDLDAGNYTVEVGDKVSYPFEVKEGVYDEAFKTSMRSFYFQRASTEIVDDIYARPVGHPDTAVIIHPSVSSSLHAVGSKINLSKGWYDAGDFGKYTVPAGVTLWELLSLVEYTDLNEDLGIPESGDDVNDILDECKWELDWMLSMQDVDGGLFHKVSTSNFESDIMPHNATMPRYVYQKSSSASLTAAGVFAKASRIYESVDGSYATQLIEASKKAWIWGNENITQRYKQNEINEMYEPDDKTGGYGFESYTLSLSDEIFWASSELFITTGEEQYKNSIQIPSSMGIPKWESYDCPAVISLLFSENGLSKTDSDKLSDLLLSFADKHLKQYEESPYGMMMGTESYDYSWGSNGKASNQAMVMLYAYYFSGKREYFEAALANIDYIFGMNPLNQCFLTGFGTQTSVNIHHRVSRADGIPSPVPGLLANGPHNTSTGECFYLSDLPPLTYVDEYCSSATNEISIYDGAAITHALGLVKYLQEKNFPTAVEEKVGELTSAFPVPTSGELNLDSQAYDTYEIISASGKLVIKGEVLPQIDISSLMNSIYVVKLYKGNEVLHTQKIPKI